MGKTTFTKDEQNARLTIERTFRAPRSRVWEALTHPAILDQWWAPKPWMAQTLHMDFRVGGYWHYAMNGPDGEQHFGRMSYLEIEPEQRFMAADVFADESGTAVEDLPTQTFETTLAEEGDTTTVVIVVQYKSLEDLERIIAMGMQEGLTMAQDQLALLLERG
jgi:uncharacterized protein YndB with AHSA1/START domain